MSDKEVKRLVKINSSESSRLQYRVISKDDLEDVRLLHNHPLILSKLTDARPVNQIEQELWFNSISSSKSRYRIIVRQKSTKELVGVFRIDQIDLVNQSSSVGLDVVPRMHRQGYGREIYVHMIEYLFNDWNLFRLHLETLESNQPARGLYESLGFKLEGIGREAIYRAGRRENLVFYALLKPDWRYR